jgi:hypothetical protein
MLVNESLISYVYVEGDRPVFCKNKLQMLVTLLFHIHEVPAPFGAQRSIVQAEF